MSIEKQIKPYEILIRLDDAGAVSGCHRRDLEIVINTETGEVYSSKERDPQPIVGADMDAVLGVINTGLTVALDSASAANAQLNQLLSDRDASIAQLNSAAAEKDAALEQAVLQVQSLQQVNAELTARVAELEAASAGA